MAEAGITIDYNFDALKKYDVKADLSINTAMDNSIAILKLFPGINKETIAAILNTDHVKGVVLESYGSGNVPHEPWFLDQMAHAISKHKVILNISQCNGGRVIQGKYQTSSHLEKIGVISGRDLTTEAATAKLMFALANHKNVADINHCLTTTISGEMA